MTPDVTMDISNRAISFYAFQLSQEIVYRTTQASDYEMRYNESKQRNDAIVRDLSENLKSTYF